VFLLDAGRQHQRVHTFQMIEYLTPLLRAALDELDGVGTNAFLRYHLLRQLFDIVELHEFVRSCDFYIGFHAVQSMQYKEKLSLKSQYLFCLPNGIP